ncbi:TetR/AcrR family transcriptional regulator [Jiangella alba]|uniref:DNA-binding transcriptional regulator YbjK n=1 Tax=Jiangella alba TaxID=561176 RepID=A0A1H5CDF5_9ACTN|nr:TetR family transcriptional regulator [Jiangella alba]SED64340.1 DNA-binding transcriptional regulator YbjK [Jiangella alba]
MPTDPARAAADGRRTRGAQTRRRLLDAAMRVVSRDGPQGVTHRAVAAEAGVSKSLATYHFATIEELLVAALVECTEEFAHELAESLPATSTPAGLAHYFAASFNADREAWLGSYELLLHAARRPALREAALAWPAWTARLARRYTDDPAAVDAFVATLDGAGLLALLTDAPLDADRLARLFERILLPGRTSRMVRAGSR